MLSVGQLSRELVIVTGRVWLGTGPGLISSTLKPGPSVRVFFFFFFFVDIYVYIISRVGAGFLGNIPSRF